jgi:hypothetical protein
MNFFQHTINWLRGEILEASIMAGFGFFSLISGILFKKIGSTPYSKAMFIPLVVVGVILLFGGVYGVVSNRSKLSTYSRAWHNDNQTFVLKEKERVEGFDDIFKYSYPFAISFVISGSILFFLVSSPTWKSISLSMMILGMSAYIIDHFAAERASIYYENILEFVVLDNT